MRKTLQLNELIESVKAQEWSIVENRPAKSKKQAMCDFENVCDMLDYASEKLQGIESITLDYENYINLGDVLKAIYLKQLRPNTKHIELTRCESVEISNKVETLVLTCCKSRARKINELKEYDNIKYIIFTKTYKVEALISYDLVVGLDKPNVSYIVKNAKSVKPLI